MGYGLETWDRERVGNAVSIAQAQEFVKENYQAEVAQGGSNFSGGQKQRLSIARAIAKKPEILVFDDSFSALDYKTDRILRSAIRQKMAGTTNIIVAQRIGTIIQKSVTEYLKTANKPAAFQTMLRAVFFCGSVCFLLCARQVQRLCHQFHAV